MTITVLIRPGRSAGYLQAYCPDLVGCSAIGTSVEQAVGKLRERIAAHLAEQGRPTPAADELQGFELQTELRLERESGL